jgi:hypothetical protein
MILTLEFKEIQPGGIGGWEPRKNFAKWSARIVAGPPCLLRCDDSAHGMPARKHDAAMIHFGLRSFWRFGF